MDIAEVLNRLQAFKVHNPDTNCPVGIGLYESGHWHITFRNSTPQGKFLNLIDAMDWIDTWLLVREKETA